MIRQAFEVYSLTGQGYNGRKIWGYAWTQDDVNTLKAMATEGSVQVMPVHLIDVNGRWHRVHANPAEYVIGDIEQAVVSRIERNDLPKPQIPAIYLLVEGQRPRRVPADLDKVFRFISAHDKDNRCKLYTLRPGSPPPVNFVVRDLYENDKVQETVYRWLEHEVKIRKECHETP